MDSPSVSFELGQRRTAARRQEIARQLSELRAILRDLTTHGPSKDATVEERAEHFDAVDDVKAKIHALDLEYIRLA